MDTLVTADWVAANLPDPSLRIFDSTVQVHRFFVRNGRSAWRRQHIPGSGFADLFALSDPSAPRRTFTMPDEKRFTESIGRMGVSNDSRVVVQDARENMWAARLWWMLRAFGFDNAAVLDGGWRAWSQDRHPVCSRRCGYPAATCLLQPRAGLIADKGEVLAAIGDPDVCLVNALGRRQHRGEVNEYGRPGHIPGSRNLTAWEVLDRETQRYRPAAELRRKAEAILESKRVITYCGGGVAAASIAFVLTRLGHGNVAVYDGGLMEWCADPALPLELGP